MVKVLDKNLLRGAIASAGLTQKQLANAIGISENTFSMKINGIRYFDTLEIDKICHTLGINDCNQKVKIFLSDSSQNRDDSSA